MRWTHQSYACCYIVRKTHTLFITLASSVIQVLHCCVSGSNLHTQQSHYLLSLSDLSSDYDLMLGQVKSCDPPPSQTNTADFGNLLTVAEGKYFKCARSELSYYLLSIKLYCSFLKLYCSTKIKTFVWCLFSMIVCWYVKKKNESVKIRYQLCFVFVFFLLYWKQMVTGMSVLDPVP